MTKEERLAAIQAIQDILAARAASASGGSLFGGGRMGGPSTIPIDPNLNTPMPASRGGGNQQQVNDPDGILSKMQPTKVDMPTDSSKPDTPQPDTTQAGGSQGGDGGGDGATGAGNAPANASSKDENNPDHSSDTTDYGDQTEQSDPSEGSGNLGGGSSDLSDPEEPEDESGLSSNGTKSDDQPQLSQDYKDAWNAVMAKYDQDDISPEQLEQLIAQIQNGALKI